MTMQFHAFPAAAEELVIATHFNITGFLCVFLQHLVKDTVHCFWQDLAQQSLRSLFLQLVKSTG